MEGRDGKTTDASRYVISLKSDQRVGGIGFFTISLSLL